MYNDDEYENMNQQHARTFLSFPQGFLYEADGHAQQLAMQPQQFIQQQFGQQMPVQQFQMIPQNPQNVYIDRSKALSQYIGNFSNISHGCSYRHGLNQASINSLSLGIEMFDIHPMENIKEKLLNNPKALRGVAVLCTRQFGGVRSRGLEEKEKCIELQNNFRAIIESDNELCNAVANTIESLNREEAAARGMQY